MAATSDATPTEPPGLAVSHHRRLREGHAELAGVAEPTRQRLLNTLALFHVGEMFTPPPPPTEPCTCEWGQHREANAGVAILDGHCECPFCRGLIDIGSEDEESNE